MSFDLAVWYEDAPLSHQEAAAKYEALSRNEDIGLAEHRGLAAIHEDLVARYSMRDSSADVDRHQTIWSAAPKIVANAVRLSIVMSAATAVGPIVRGLAEREGLVYFDPQRGRARLPSTMSLLQLYGGVFEATTKPDSERVAQAVVKTVNARSHLVLEKGTERYVQVSSALHGALGVEYRDGGPEHHFRYETTDISEVQDIFDSYLHDDDGWRSRYDWEQFRF